MEDKKKLYGTLLGVSVFALVIVGLSVAWLVWRSTNTNISINSDCFTINYSKGQDISNAKLKLLNENDIISDNNITITTGMALTTASIGIDSSCNIEGYGILKLNVTSLSDAFTTGDSVGSLKYVVVSYNPSTYPDVTVDALNNVSFTILSKGSITSTGTKEILLEQLSNSVVNNYIIIIYIDGSLAGNNIIGSTFSGTISAEAEQGKLGAALIKSLYTPNTTAVNNSITYNLDSTNNLMEDVAGNIRYYGASPNNYIDIGDVYKKDTTFNNWELVGRTYDSTEACYDDFDCDTHYSDWEYDTVDACKADIPNWLDGTGYSTVEELCGGTTTIPQGTPKLYRIIGLFKDIQLADGTKQDLIKVVREESIGEYSWDSSASDVNSGHGVNEWSGADLMKLINPGYESESIGGSLWYNSGSGTCYSGGKNKVKTCDFTGTGLSDNVKNKIAEVTWNLGGWNISEVYPNQIYEYERGTNVVIPGTTCSGEYCNDTITRTTSWTGKVALAYPSDYGYAADLTQCSQTLASYDNATCTSNNWLYNGAEQWLLTPASSRADRAWDVSATGFVRFGGFILNAFVVRPVLYLSSDTGIVSGDGSETDPYRIS